MVSRQKSSKQLLNTVPRHQICLLNKFAPLEVIEKSPESIKVTSMDKLSSTSVKKKVNKRFTQYQPTWLSSPKQAKLYPRNKQSTSKKLVDINALEMETMKKIQLNPHLSEYQRVAVSNMINCIQKDDAAAGNICVSSLSENKALKLNGGGKTIKIFNSKNDNVNNSLHVLRSSKFFSLFKNHLKCPVTEECNFCLLRSCLLKINHEKGRNKIQPIEVECQRNVIGNTSADTCVALLQKAAESFKELTNPKSKSKVQVQV